jgi:hypothetical protein
MTTTAQPLHRTQEQDQLSAELVSLALANPRSIAFHVLYQFHPEFSLWIHNFPCCAALPSPTASPARTH